MSAVQVARQLAEQRPAHPVISIYLDLDPERFATPPARASQTRSLLDEAGRRVDGDQTLDHEDRVALREDLERIRSYLLSREPPFKGARSLAVFCAGRDDLFEVVQVARPVQGQVHIERTPYVEPLVRASSDRTWCVALVNRRTARILTGSGDRLQQRETVSDDTHGQHDQGGWSQAGYERSVEQDTDGHLRGVADQLYRHWQRARFDCLALGGPQEIVPRFESFLHDDLRSRLAPGRVDVDVQTATEDQICAALSALIAERDRERERAALDRMAAGLGSGGRAAAGPEDTLGALAERRVATLLIEDGFDRSGGRCPSCGLLSLETSGTCSADGTPLEEIPHLREAVVQAALAQDAEVIVVERYPDLGPFEGIGALLRF